MLYIRWFFIFSSAVLTLTSSPFSMAQTVLSPSDMTRMNTLCLGGDADSCDAITRHYDQIARAGGNSDISESDAWRTKIDWAEKGCLKGGRYSCDAAGWAYEHGKESRPVNHESAYVYYQNGCIHNSALSCNNLALAQAFGRGAPKDAHAALNTYTKACRLGYMDACWSAYNTYKTTPSKLAAEAAGLGCDQDDKNLCLNAGNMYFESIGVPKNAQKAFAYFTKGCDLNQAMACLNAGNMLYNGKDLSQNIGKAASLYDKSCQLGAQKGCEYKDIAWTKLTGEKAPKSQPSKTAPAKVISYADAAPQQLDNACFDSNDSKACIELYKRYRGQDPNAFYVAEHLCFTFNWADYCYAAGVDLLLGNGGTVVDRTRAYNNFYKGCYVRGKGRSESCYQGAILRLADGGRNGNYDAMLMLESPCYAGYRDSCALKKKAQRGGDAAVAAANAKLRANHDDALRCEKTKIIGNGGRSYISYDCRTNMEWRLGKKR